MDKRKIENDVEIAPNDKKKSLKLRRLSAFTLGLFTAFYIWEARNSIKMALPFDAYKDKENKLLELSNRIGITIDPEIDDNLLIVYYGLTNDNLTNEEKEGFLYLIDLLRDNPYIDINTASKYIANLDVEYPIKINERKIVQARYLYSLNKIRMYQDSLKSDEIYIHELIHAIFNHGRALDLPEVIVEGVTDLLVNEYTKYNWQDELESYVFETVMIKVLCEMTSSDTILKTYTLGEMQYITDDLKEYMSDETVEKYIKLMTDIFDNIYFRNKVSQEELDELLSLTDNYMNDKYPNDEIVLERYNYYRGILDKMSSDELYLEAQEYIKHHESPSYPYFSSQLKNKYIEENDGIKTKKLVLTNNQ